ncbi:hypothetical protein GCM10012280_63520 [Wenjunlia tyrosinilytica]|uniref:Reverse transcriptase domain-containing protein n=1 Tax=Wenjunlia tyrosinilytica TaxID=1544741 RepID=A0A917ZYH6_9ACTN|nr:hypothetical protein GCM10012280_63520 [Wenjunlia tyrosinilytica]
MRPQGGVISPVLLKIALHGMETAAGVQYRQTGRRGGDTMPGSPLLVRYADDLVALCHSREQAEQVKARLAEWLKPRGLVFNEDKTRVVHLEEGCDFLGFTIRRYHGKLLIKPSREAVRRIRNRLRAEVRSLPGANVAAVLQRLNPIIRGWSAYYRNVVASEIFTALDDCMWKLTYKWATRAHPNKPRHWVTARYYGKFNKSRQDQWVFGDRDSGAYCRNSPDEDRPTPDGPWLGVPGRSCSGHLLGRTAPQQRTTAHRPRHPASAPGAERAVSDLPGPAAARRRPAVQPHRMGAMAAGHPPGDHRQEDHLSRGRHVGRGAAPSHPLDLWHCTSVSPWGLLEPSCGESPHGREGGPPQ